MSSDLKKKVKKPSRYATSTKYLRDDLSSLKKILIVDDELFNLQALKIIFHYSMGINVDSMIDFAKNGEEALEKVKRNVTKNNNKSCDYKLILMDCNMPFMDGYEATEQIRLYLFNKQIEQPIISAVTGHTEPMYVDKAF